MGCSAWERGCRRRQDAVGGTELRSSRADFGATTAAPLLTCAQPPRQSAGGFRPARTAGTADRFPTSGECPKRTAPPHSYPTGLNRPVLNHIFHSAAPSRAPVGSRGDAAADALCRGASAGAARTADEHTGRRWPGSWTGPRGWCRAGPYTARTVRLLSGRDGCFWKDGRTGAAPPRGPATVSATPARTTGEEGKSADRTRCSDAGHGPGTGGAGDRSRHSAPPPRLPVPQTRPYRPGDGAHGVGPVRAAPGVRRGGRGSRRLGTHLGGLTRREPAAVRAGQPVAAGVASDGRRGGAPDARAAGRHFRCRRRPRGAPFGGAARPDGAGRPGRRRCPAR